MKKKNNYKILLLGFTLAFSTLLIKCSAMEKKTDISSKNFTKPFIEEQSKQKTFLDEKENLNSIEKTYENIFSKIKEINLENLTIEDIPSSIDKDILISDIRNFYRNMNNNLNEFLNHLCNSKNENYKEDIQKNLTKLLLTYNILVNEKLTNINENNEIPDNINTQELLEDISNCVNIAKEYDIFYKERLSKILNNEDIKFKYLNFIKNYVTFYKKFKNLNWPENSIKSMQGLCILINFIKSTNGFKSIINFFGPSICRTLEFKDIVDKYKTAKEKNTQSEKNCYIESRESEHSEENYIENEKSSQSEENYIENKKSEKPKKELYIKNKKSSKSKQKNYSLYEEDKKSEKKSEKNPNIKNNK